MGMALSTRYPFDTLEITGSIRRIEKVTRTHIFSIVGYSLDKDIGKGNFLESTIFNAGGHDWSILYYLNGCDEAEDDDISIYLHLKSKSECVKAQLSFAILDQSGCVLLSSERTEIANFSTDLGNCYSSFFNRALLEAYMKDDCFGIKIVVSVFKVLPVEPIEVFAVLKPTAQIVPPGNVLQQFGHLLENRNGADVTFEVDGQTISAHKCILAARSPVFSAQFFGLMKEKSDTIIKIEEMEAPVFKALLYFIYNDSIPVFEEIKENNDKHDTTLMAEHLLVAADGYGLERLMIICENILCDSIDTSNVITMLSLAERHSCNHLKATCLKFLASPEILQGIATTEQFRYFNWKSSINLKKPSVKRQYGLLLPVTVVLFLFFFVNR